MATIADKIQKADGTALNAGIVYFVPVATVAIGTAGVSAVAVSDTTDSSGNFSISLTPGQFRVRWRFSSSVMPDELTIVVPDDDETYGLGDLETDGVSSGSIIRAILGASSLTAKASYADRQLEFLDYLDASGDGQGGWFKFDAASTSTADGIDILIPDNITHPAPGRWLRVIYT